jgi:hypothetical protein
VRDFEMRGGSQIVLVVWDRWVVGGHMPRPSSDEPLELVRVHDILSAQASHN